MVRDLLMEPVNLRRACDIKLIRTRALASQRLQTQNFAGALKEIESGLETIRTFYQEYQRTDLQEQSPELFSLQNWLDELNKQRPLSRREQLEIALADAVKREDYEKAAQVRDELKNLKTSDS